MKRIKSTTFIIATIFYLPLFILGVNFEIKIRGLGTLSEGVFYHLSGAIVMYFALIIPFLIGVLVYELSQIIFSKYLTKTIRIALFSPLIPLTVYLLPRSGGSYLEYYYTSTIISSIIFTFIVIYANRERV